MTFAAIQLLTGLAGSATLFLIAAGLTVIFGVTRIVNFAHGSLFMLGAYLGWSILARLPHTPVCFALGVLAAALAVAAIGALLETAVLRHLYAAPPLLQLLATFGVMLIIHDATLFAWGPDDLPLPRPPWLRAWVPVLGERFPRYDLVLIAIGPLVLGALLLLLGRSRFGVLIRACTENRSIAAALGIDQRRLSTAIFALGAGLAGLGGALVLPDASANLGMDLSIIVEAFVVVVVGGLGSIAGAFLASLLIGLLQAFGLVLLPQATLVLVFVIMAAVLTVRPQGLLGSAQPEAGRRPVPLRRIAPAWGWAGLLLAAGAPFWLPAYPLAILTEVLVAALFAAALHLLVGPGGMISFGHAAWFAIGAYAAGLATRGLAAPMPAALLLAPVAAGLAAAAFGTFVVRLSGIYLAMLTLAFAQIVWAVAKQWLSVTGGDDGILGVWPSGPVPFYWWALGLSAGGIWLLQRCVDAPFGLALIAVRDSERRARTVGLDPERLRMAAFTLSGAAAGLAGGLGAFRTGSVFPAVADVGRSVDGLLMVLLGGVDAVAGPVIGALVYTSLYDWLLLAIPFWRLALGIAILALVLAFPGGLAGTRRQA
ncbi:MAG TPA: ABC transporter permease [Rhodopila sp.]|uniref:ABC transporter permease n=1 Tax=Rhodopila sp. TaxID=2480087 RepID=UPI002C255AD9|nr:ABC transporter permease [Rhodopila sp.]HVY13588.1 ABC transporter permease [Rhodopila sp.]